MEALFTGLGLGLVVAVSFGPINVLELDSGLRFGFAPALGVGFGAALADGTYAFLGGLGAAALVAGPTEGWLQIVGGGALLAIATSMVRRPRTREERASPGFRRMFGVSLLATLANPLTIVYWAAAFGGVVPELRLSRLDALTLLPLGVLTGTAVWTTVLAIGSAFAGRYVSERLLGRLSLVSALTIAGFGAWLVAAGVRTLS
jgi:threonine/homoserine/homoserine lactone efflux protein